MKSHSAVMPGVAGLVPYRTSELAPGVQVTMGLPQGGGQSAAMSYHFQANRWSERQAREWLARHGVRPESFKVYEEEPKLHEHGWVQVFKVGTHTDSNGSKDSFTEADLDEMVEAFAATYPKLHEPPLRLGEHEETEGSKGERLPGRAAGWVGGLKRDGQYLLAKLVDLPEAVMQAIRGKEYKKVSAGIALNREVEGKRYPKMLDHLALLGAKIPAVKGLESLQTTFLSEAASPAGVECRHYSWAPSDDKAETKPKEETMELEKQIQSLANSVEAMVKFHEQQQKPDKAAEELAAAQAKIKAYEQEKLERGIQTAIDSIRTYCEERVKAGTMKPATRDNLLKALETQRTYSEGDGKTDGTLSIPWPVVKEFAEGLGVALNTKETGKGKGSDDGKPSDPAAALDSKVRAYAAEKQVNYDEALQAVKALHPELLEAAVAVHLNQGGD